MAVTISRPTIAAPAPRRRHSNPISKLPAPVSPVRRCTSAPARVLPRPALRAARRETLMATEPALAQVPTDYIIKALKSQGPEMYDALAHARTIAPQSALPRELATTTNSATQAPPTHILAVYSRASGTTQTRVSLYPAHALVLATTCTNLPALPAPTTEGKIPVAPLCLPDGTSFPALLQYLYRRQPSALVGALLRPAGSDRRAAAARVHGLWRDACALGVNDEGFWDALDAAWSIVMGTKA